MSTQTAKTYTDRFHIGMDDFEREIASRFLKKNRANFLLEYNDTLTLLEIDGVIRYETDNNFDSPLFKVIASNGFFFICTADGTWVGDQSRGLLIGRDR